MALPTRQSSTDRRVRRLAVLLAAALITLCAVWGWRLFPEREIDESRPRSTKASAAQRTEGSSIEVLDAWPEASTAQQDATDNASGEAATPPPSARLVRVHFRQGEHPVAPLEVILQLFQAGRVVDRRVAVSDAQSELILRLPLTPDELLLRCNDDRYHFGEQRVALTQIEVAVDIQVIRLIDIELSVAYDDGLPFSGEGCFVRQTADPVRPTQVHAENGEWKSGSDSFQVVGGKRALKGIIATDCELWFYTKRAGYDRYTEKVLARDLTDGARLTITIKPSKHPMGCLILDFGDRQWDRQIPWSYHVANIAQPLLKQGSLVNSPPEDNKLIINPLLEGEYRAWVACESLCWQQIIRIKAGQTTEVAVTLTPECKVSVTIQDESGRPLIGAVVLPDTGDVPAFPARPRKGFTGVSNYSGLATLDGLTADTAQVMVAAEGYEPVSLRVSLNPGTVSHAGEVRLVPAEGVLTVRILNAQPGVQYAAMYNHPSGRGGRSPSQFVGSTGEAVFDRLPLRQYLVAVTLAGGGKLVSRLVTLSPQEREAVVELDVTGINPAPQEK